LASFTTKLADDSLPPLTGLFGKRERNIGGGTNFYTRGAGEVKRGGKKTQRRGKGIFLSKIFFPPPLRQNCKRERKEKKSEGKTRKWHHECGIASIPSISQGKKKENGMQWKRHHKGQAGSFCDPRTKRKKLVQTGAGNIHPAFQNLGLFRQKKKKGKGEEEKKNSIRGGKVSSFPNLSLDIDLKEREKGIRGKTDTGPNNFAKFSHHPGQQPKGGGILCKIETTPSWTRKES